MTTQKKATAPAKPKKERVEIFTKKYFSLSGKIYSVGDTCDIDDVDELEKLTEVNALKTVVKEV